MGIVMKFYFIALFFTQLLFSQTLAFNHSELSENIDEPNQVTLDGFVGINEWHDAQHIDQFKQISPSLGNLPTEKTDVYVRYDKDFLYVAVKAYTTNELFASVMGRDESLDTDDNIELVIDTYNDKTNALVFATNPLGAKKDYELSGNGDDRNESWNTFWDVVSQKTEFGWSAEYKIPFSSLRYEVKDINVMGFKVLRYIRSSNERLISPLKYEDIKNRDYNLQNTSELSFTGLESKNPFYFTPYITSNYGNSYALNSAETAYENTTSFHSGKGFLGSKGLDQLLSNIGFDLKYKLSNTSTLDITMNTDFAQAEADDRVINLSRFSVYQPEKRGFFLENADIFSFFMDFGNNLFHSRTIGLEDGKSLPIIGGARLTGTLGDIQYGALNMQTKAVEDVDALNYSVLRVKKSISSDKSYIGFMGASKQSTERSDLYNHTIGIDGHYLFGDKMEAVGYLSGVYTEKNASDNLSFGGRLSRFSPTGYSTNFVYTQLEDEFDPALGFIRRNGIKRYGMWHGYGWNFKDHPTINSFDMGWWSSKTWHNKDNSNAFFGTNIWALVVLKNGWRIMGNPIRYQVDYLEEAWEFSDKLTIPAGRYSWYAGWLNINSGNAYDYTIRLQSTYQGFYNGTLFRFSPSVNYILNKHITLDGGVNFNQIQLPSRFSTNGNGKQTRTLVNLRGTYSFSSSTSIKAFIQYDNTSETLGSNIRLRYNPTEGTDLYIVYNQNMNTNITEREELIKPRFQNQAIILKFAKTFLY